MKTIIFIISSLLFLASCEKVPTFSDTPEIEFDSIDQVVVFDPLTLAQTDSITISVGFKDGDGDLGLDNGEANTGKYVGEYSKNFHLTFFKKINGVFKDITNDGPVPLDFGGAFERLAPTDEIAPIEGRLSNHLLLLHVNNSDFITQHDTLRFEVYVYDRALNRSNTITTSEIIFWE